MKWEEVCAAALWAADLHPVELGVRREADTMLTAHAQIEQQLTVLLRRSVRIHLITRHGELALERSAYAILSRLADDGAQRPSMLAAAFGVESSTITRQVQELERSGLAMREEDPSDRRAFVLRPTPQGRDVLRRTRAHRRAKLQQALVAWPEADVHEFGRLLKEFNACVDRLTDER